MDVIVRSNNSHVDDRTALMSGLINVLTWTRLLILRVVKVCLDSGCSGYSYHQQDKQVMGGCLCNH